MWSNSGSAAVTYRLVISEQERFDAKPGDTAKRYEDWYAENGVFNTLAGKLHTEACPMRRWLVFTVTFDSRAWTG